MMTKFKSFLTTAGVAALALPALAQAQVSAPNPSTYLSQVSDSDASVSVFRYLVGDFFLNPLSHVGGSQGMIGSLFTVFNAFVFLIAVLWMSYGMVFKVVQTATKGEVLGSNMSNAWLPVRWITGIAGIVPIFGGFSLAQVLLVGVAALGIGVANMAMGGIVRATADFQGLTPAVMRTTAGVDFDQMARGIFATRVCYRAVAEEQQASATPFSEAQVIRQQPVQGALSSYAFGTAEAPGLCGGASVHRSDTAPRQQDSITSFRVNSVQYDEIAGRVQNAFARNFDGFRVAVERLADEWYDRRRTNAAAPVDVTRMRQAISSYAASVSTEQEEINDSNLTRSRAITQEAADKMREVGWFGLGAWFSTFAEVNAALADAAKSVELRVTAPQRERLAQGVLGQDSELAAQIDHAFMALSKAERAESNATEGQTSEAFKRMCNAIGINYSANDTGNCSIGQLLVMKALGATAQDSGGSGLVNPIIMFKNMGDYAMWVGQIIIGTLALLPETVSKLLGAAMGALSSGSAGGAATANPGGAISAAGLGAAAGAAAMKMLPTLGVLLFTVGALMALYIPMIPFITWMGGLVQYAVVVVEGLVGMPIAALSHLDSEGEGLGSRTERGYIFLLNVCFRPILMIFGFIAASALMIALGTLQAMLFLPAMANLQGNSVTGLASIIGLLVIFFVINVTLIQGLFNMIFLLPDQVLGLIGNGNTDPIGRETEDKVNRLFMAGAYVARDMAPAAMARKAAEDGKKSNPSDAANPGKPGGGGGKNGDPRKGK